MNSKFKLLSGFIMILPAIILAQSPVSGFMKAKGQGSFTVSFSSENYNEVYLVPKKVDQVPVFNEVTVESFSLYGEYAFSDRFNVVLNLPYIKSTGEATQETLDNNGFENERSGLQDLSLYGKYRIYSKDISSGSIDFIGSAGIEFPLGDYAADEGLQSIIAIGNRSTDFTGLGIVTYKNNSGFFTTGQLGYSLRNNQVPDALLSELKLGYAASSFYVDAFVANQLSDKEGVDILGEGFVGFFPATRVNYTRIGLNGYVPVSAGIGISAGVNTYVAGRNLGDSTGFYGGLSYSF